MRKFGYASLVFTLAASILFAGCFSQPAPTPGAGENKPAETAAPQELRVNIAAEPSTVDPGLAEDIPSMSVARAAFDGLLRIGTDGKLHEAVAEKYEVSPDLLTYTFHLRDTKWSNGDPVTAQDFEFAWKRVLNPETASGYAYQMYYLKNGEKANAKEVSLDEVGVKATDDKTLVVTLQNPSPFFPELIASVTYFPVNKKVVESNPKWASEAATYVGNGPFVIDKWEHKSQIVWKKNDTYWDKDSVKLSKMTYNMIEDANTELSMFEAGELDWAGSPLGELPGDAMQSLKDSGKLNSQATAGTEIFVFNTTKVPFTNKNVRKAFAYAIDRKALTENVVTYKGTPALGYLPPSMALNKDGYFKDADVETAKKLLAQGMQELGLKELPPLEVLYNTSEKNTRMSQAIQDQWRKSLGVEVTLKNQENKVKREQMKQGNFIIGRGSWIGDFNDPINFLELYRDLGGNNNAAWTNAEFKDLLVKSATEADTAKRTELLKKADEIFHDEMPIIPLYYYTYAWAKGDGVKDVVIDALGFIDFKYASNEKK
ncbi:peptide ABC transporter substrate-binding protein [Brevibacillus sp. SYSU BS000544]|uniref:peptide ABC transporter substrate-binding protein n=1 Tax=Brevibacillus sp. SYSU BS000544 TaxID=3416443 RepID=UPI003CE4C5BD